MGWRSLDELTESKVATAVSIGVILVDDDEKIIVCPHLLVEDDVIDQGDAEIVIPKQWVMSIVELEEKDAR